MELGGHEGYAGAYIRTPQQGSSSTAAAQHSSSSIARLLTHTPLPPSLSTQTSAPMGMVSCTLRTRSYATLTPLRQSTRGTTRRAILSRGPSLVLKRQCYRAVVLVRAVADCIPYTASAFSTSRAAECEGLIDLADGWRRLVSTHSTSSSAKQQPGSSKKHKPHILSHAASQESSKSQANLPAADISLPLPCPSYRCTSPRENQIYFDEGSLSAPMIQAVNQIAAALEAEFPHVTFDTLAYMHTRRPPLHTRPRHNVVIRLCTIECDFARPLTHPNNQAFRVDLDGWSALTSRIHVWDYITNFNEYFTPFPNWYAEQATAQSRAEHTDTHTANHPPWYTHATGTP